MVETGLVTSIRQLTYQPGRGASDTVEVLSFARLRRLDVRATQRADFAVLAFVDEGRGAVSVDFERAALGPGSVVRVPPGAVHRWDDVARVEGRLVLFSVAAPAAAWTRHLFSDGGTAGVRRLPPDDELLVRAALDHLALEAGVAPGRAMPAVPELLLSALLARLGRSEPAAAPDPAATLFFRFRDLVEEHFRERHDAGFYARRLGCSPRTLSRAVAAATGTTAKAYVTARLVLEARRLLAHDRLTAARCAARLGFVDASRFSAFFVAATGERPGAWQRRATAW